MKILNTDQSHAVIIATREDLDYIVEAVRLAESCPPANPIGEKILALLLEAQALR